MDGLLAYRQEPVTSGPPDIPSQVLSRQLFAIISTSIVLGFAIISYGLRLWARKRSFQKLQMDDYLMGAGLLITLEPAICEYLCKEIFYIAAEPALTESNWQCCKMVSGTTYGMSRRVSERIS
jgi:hypothetical protein